MDITCGDCGTRFRLDVALLKGEKGARIRCRKCGGRIVVRLPEESPVAAPVPPPQETGPPSTVEQAAPAQEWVSPWPVEPTALAWKPTAFEADISGVVGSGPVPPPPDETAVPPDPDETAVPPDNVNIEPEPAAPLAATGLTLSVPHTAPAEEPVPSGMPGTIYHRVEDLFAFPPGEDAGPDRIPPPPEEYPAEEVHAEETAVPEPERKVPPRSASSRSTFPIIFVLCLLLLAAGAFYFGTTKAGRERLGTVFPGWATPPGSVAETPYDIRNVKLSFEKETVSGTLFVVTGEVANVGNAPSAGIRVRATLLGKDNQALAEKTAFAGNPLDNASLGRMDRPAIEGAMSNRFGHGNANRVIAPGKVLPFMVLFFDPPVEIDAVKVKADDAR